MMTTPNHQEDNALSQILSQRININWEVIVYIVIFLFAVFTRFYILGDRVMSHDESLHTRFSYNLYADGNFQHTPLMHGPVLFHTTALSYYLFGDNDFTSRIYTSLLGVMMVMFPLLFRRWLGRWGAILASMMLLISPIILYYNRYIRHDTPSILFGMIMAYCILMYINGPARFRRRAYWLHIFAAAMVLNLGSKETAFIYIAIFGSFLGIYWLVRLAQHRFNWRGKPVFYSVILGILLGGVMTLGMYIIVDIVPAMIVPGRGTPWGELTDIQRSSWLTWTLLVIFSGIFVTISTALWIFRHRLNRLPWREVTLILLIAMITAGGLLFIEELSHFPSSTETAQPIVPGEDGADSEVVQIASSISWMPMIALWLVTGAVIVFLVYNGLRSSRQTEKFKAGDSSEGGLWGFLYQFPEFDFIILIGTLILPWTTAIFPRLMHASTTDYVNIGESLPDWLYNLYLNAPNINSPEQVGQVIVGGNAFIPLVMLMFAIGLAWNWKRWLVSAAVFHVIFIFFFTTVFTNPAGFFTGMVYSLGYWLEQQGVRRGSQPQYYYLVVIMPMYEFLPIIGSVLAMFAGVAGFWRMRFKGIERDEINRQAELDALLATENYDSELNDESLEVEELLDAQQLELIDVADDGEMLSDIVVRDRSVFSRTEQLDETNGEQEDGYLRRIPFLLMVSWWAILNLVGYSLAGEKMPWLATHMSTPMILLTAWYFGGVFSRIDKSLFLSRGWMALLVMPLFVVTGIQVVGSFFAGTPPFSGLSQIQLSRTYGWIGALILTVGLAFVLYRVARQSSGAHVRRIFAITVFGLLSLVTFRSAWLASFINYDLPTEFLVYAHAAPAIKWILEDIEEMSLRMTDGKELKFAYDNEVSWPYSWYFRDYPSAVFVGENPTVQNLDDTIFVVVGDGNRGKVEPILEDRYIRREYMRLWWPMQEYFNLTPERVMNTLDFSASNPNAALIRQGMFDIWWSRDYTLYGQVMEKDFSITNWPVSDRMHVYIRKDFASQIWEYGVGEGEVLNNMPTEVNLCTANWIEIAPILTMEATNPPMNRPLAMAIDEGLLYIAEEYSNRVSVFTTDGEYVRSYGDTGDATAATFNRPNSVAVLPNGDLLVVDTWNYRIQQINSDGNTVTQWGQPGEFGFDAPVEPTDGFWGPRDVVVGPQGRVYVTDTGNKRVRVYAFDGLAAVHQFDIGKGGSALGELDEPSGLEIHSDGRLFVADTWNRRIAVFDADGVHIKNFTVRGWYNDTVNRPYLALDEARDYLYVTDPDGNRVLVYTPDGECVGSFGQQGENTALAQFTAMSGIVVDEEGFIYISDSTAGKIYKFAPFVPPAPIVNQGEGSSIELNSEITEDIEATEDVEMTEDLEVTEEIEARG